MKPIRRLLSVPKGSFFLLGPRGTGKSTWLKQSLPAAHVVDLLDEGNYQRLLASPSRFGDEIRSVRTDRWVVVDEFQRLPNLLNEVHRAIAGSGRKFALCGSSARKLKRAGVNLLGGRAVQRRMHPFLPEELGVGFRLEDALRNGLLPVVLASKNREETLAAYAQLYLKSEIQAEALVRNLPAFARFLPIAALFHGQTLNANNIAREAAIARSTVDSYLDILEETLVCFRLPAFESKLRLRERRHPKWYWCDPGLARAMKGVFGPLTPDERGPLFEGLVAQVIRAGMDYRKLCDAWHYWAPAESLELEVDFLLTKGSSHVAIEVKSGRTFQKTWTRGLRAVQGLPGLVRRLVVYPEGPALRLESGIEVLPFPAFSDLLKKRRLFR